MDNNIIKNQESDEAIEYASAFRWAYQKSKQWKSYLWSITFLLACIQIVAATNPGNLIKISHDSIQLLIVFILIITLLLGTIGKSFKIHSWQEIGNLAQQAHDFTVLSLGAMPNFLTLSPSRIRRYSNKYKKKNITDIDNLRTWWPNYINGLPYGIAVTICQLSTLKWESELRKKYQYLLLIFSIFITLLFLVLAQHLQYTPNKIIYYLIVPATPFIGLLLDELIANYNCLKHANNASKESEKLWNRILNRDITEPDLMRTLQSIQLEWQQYRKDATQVFDWIYWATRYVMEQDMLVDSDSLVKNYKNSLKKL